MGKEKLGSPKIHIQSVDGKRFKLWMFGTVLLCATFYLLGFWHSESSSRQVIAQLKSTPSEHAAAATCATDPFAFSRHHGDASAADEDSSSAVKIFEPCPANYSEYTPCEDTVLTGRSLKFSRQRLIYRERHCPSKDELLECLIPAPPNYTSPMPWPKSLSWAWFVNVPHKELTVEKAIQNWIHYEGNKFRFPGGGTMFPKGADAYIDNINALISLEDGSIRTALDTGCGVASWGGYLMKRNVLTMSFAPRDSHEAQVQFALERGIPAMIGVLASKRLPYPARSFDMAHCSRCLIPWTAFNGSNLIEIDRVLRPGGYWVLSGPPINWKAHYKGWQRDQTDLNNEQEGIEDLARLLCWKKVVEKGDLAIWQKPLNHKNCKKIKKQYPLPHICKGENPDRAWYHNVETCITPLPDVDDVSETAGGGPLAKWPARLTAVPPRILSGAIPGVTEESYKEDTELWAKRVQRYKSFIAPLHKGSYRNIMDMNAGLGSFAAALAFDNVWVMNTVPPDSAQNTLGLIYERGLIGSYQDWCEAFSTYPRTYDLVHASGLFSMYQDKCDITYILLEIDRILRPDGLVIIRDEVDVLTKISGIVNGMRWESKMYDHENGPLVTEKILLCYKEYWTSADSAGSSKRNGKRRHLQEEELQLPWL